jgi:hypothetical protein
MELKLQSTGGKNKIFLYFILFFVVLAMTYNFIYLSSIRKATYSLSVSVENKVQKMEESNNALKEKLRYISSIKSDSLVVIYSESALNTLSRINKVPEPFKGKEYVGSNNPVMNGAFHGFLRNDTIGTVN